MERPVYATDRLYCARVWILSHINKSELDKRFKLFDDGDAATQIIT